MADFTYDILVNILGEQDATNFARTLRTAGIEVQKFSRMSRGANGSLVEETQFAIKRLNQQQRDLVRFYSNAFRNTPNGGGTGQYRENYTGQTPQGMARRIRLAQNLANIQGRVLRQQQKQIELDARHASQASNSNISNQFKLNDALRKQIDAEDQLVNVEKKRRAAIQQLINESQHYHGMAVRYAEMERNARVNGDNAAAQSHHLYFQRYVSESRRMASEAERAAKRELRAAENSAQRQERIIRNLVSLKHSLWAIGALVGVERLASGFRGITDHIYEAYKASVEFNDEAVKAQTLFTSLGIGDTGQSQMDIERGGAGITASMKKQLEGAKLMGKDLTDLLREESAKTGQDFSEIMGVAKAALPDLKNKMGVSDKEFLAKGGDVKQFTKDLIELSAVMKMVDEKGRKMSFHTVGILEAFTGSGGDGKKGSGAANFLSLLRRENIKLKTADQKAITDAINARNPFKAMEAMKKALKGAGIDANNINTLLSKTREANISGVTNAFKTMGGAITETSRTLEMKFFSSMRINMARIIANDGFKKMFKGWDKALGGFVDRILGDLTKAMDFLAQNPQLIDNAFKSAIATMNEFYTITKEVIDLGAAFFEGFFSQDTIDGFKMADAVDRVKVALIALRPTMVDIGKNGRMITNAFGTLGSMTFNGLVFTLKLINNLINLMKIGMEGVASAAGTLSTMFDPKSETVSPPTAVDAYVRQNGGFGGYDPRTQPSNLGGPVGGITIHGDVHVQGGNNNKELMKNLQQAAGAYGPMMLPEGSQLPFAAR